MPRDPRALLWDVQQVGEAIAEFIAGLDERAYAESELVHSAVERKFAIIGEALNQLSKLAPSVAAEITDLSKIVAFRNQLMHTYVAVDHATVWGVANTSLPKLMNDVNALLTKLPDA
jgi:uncharacterized protein with HEPN domain